MVKSPNSVAEVNQFNYSASIALQAGSDIGFWSEAGFAENLTLRNNRFTHSITGANELSDGSGALGTIYFGMSPPQGAKGFQSNFQDRNVAIQGNRIDDSFIYAIFVSNADGVRIIDDIIGQTFIRGSAFDAGKFYGATPNSAIFVGRARNAEISNNKVARGRVTKTAVAVDRTCVKGSIHVGNNVLTRRRMARWPKAPTLAVCGTKRLSGDPNRQGVRHMPAADDAGPADSGRLPIGPHDASRRNPGQFVGLLVVGGERVAIRAGRAAPDLPLVIPGAAGG